MEINYKYFRDEIPVEVIEVLRNTIIAGLDIESCNRDYSGMEFGLCPHRGRPRIIQLTPEHNKYTYIFDLRYLPQDQIDILINCIYQIKIIVIHNAVFELKMLWGIGIDLTNCKSIYCSLIAEYILTNGLGISRSLKEVYLRYLGIDISKEQQLSDWSAEVLTEEQLSYAALDSYLVLPIRTKQKEKANDINIKYMFKDPKANIFTIFKIEFDFLPYIAALEYNGLPFDLELWQKNLPVLQQELIQEELSILKLLPNCYKQTSFTGEVIYSVNISSNKQLLDQLQKLGVPTESTNEKDLTLLGISKYPILIHLFKYRELYKIINTYLIPAAQWINPVTNRVHSSFFQAPSKSGRVQVKNPSIFTIPRGKSFRECFVSKKEDEWFLDLDYAQVESRVASVLANEISMIQVFNNDEDIYVDAGANEKDMTLEQLLELKQTNPKEFKDIRQLAKPLVLAFSFAMGANKYRDYAETMFKVIRTLDEAYRQRNKFFSKYSKLAQWHKDTWKKWEGKDYIYNQTGRIYFGQIDYCFSINYGVQSLATDFFKQACGHIFKYLKDKYGLPILNKSAIYPVCYWHDAATFNGKKEVLELEQPIIEQMMSKYAEEMLDHKVSIKAEGKVEKDWYLAHA